MIVHVSFPIPSALINTLSDLGVSPGALVEALSNQLFELAFQACPQSIEYYEVHALLEELAGEWHQLLESHPDQVVLLKEVLPHL